MEDKQHKEISRAFQVTKKKKNKRSSCVADYSTTYKGSALFGWSYVRLCLDWPLSYHL